MFIDWLHVCLLIDYRGYKEEELGKHINKMHEYNEIKDIGQMVLGRLGE